MQTLAPVSTPTLVCEAYIGCYCKVSMYNLPGIHGECVALLHSNYVVVKVQPVSLGDGYLTTIMFGIESEEEVNKTPYHSIYDARCTMTIPIILSATVLSDRDDTGCPAL